MDGKVTEIKRNEAVIRMPSFELAYTSTRIGMPRPFQPNK